MRIEVETILRAKGYEYFDLSIVARLLLVTDGTVTELLEAMVKEPITVGYKKQLIDKAENINIDAFPKIQPEIQPEIQPANKEATCLQRVITLRGTKTNVDWLYAESIIWHERLNSSVQALLIKEKIPIGNILNEHISDNHRRIVDCGIATNTAAAKRLKLNPEYAFLYRVYHIISGIETIMHISEWLPVDRINDKIFAKT